MTTTWWCTYCGQAHEPDSARDDGLGKFSQPDPRYALARCHGGRRVLVTDQLAADAASKASGKYRKPKPVIEKADANQQRLAGQGQ